MQAIGRVGGWGDVGVEYRGKDPLPATATSKTLSDINTEDRNILNSLVPTKMKN